MDIGTSGAAKKSDAATVMSYTIIYVLPLHELLPAVHLLVDPFLDTVLL